LAVAVGQVDCGRRRDTCFGRCAQFSLLASESLRRTAGAVRSHPDEPIFLAFFRHQKFSASRPAAVMTVF
jgi:hypothetical protein